MTEPNLYPPEQFICSDLLDIKEIFNSYSNAVQPGVSAFRSDHNLAAKLNIDFDALENLGKYCSVDKLQTPYQITRNDNYSALEGYVSRPVNLVPNCSSSLKTIQENEKWSKTQCNLPSYPPERDAPPTDQEFDLVPYKDVVITVNIYLPYVPKERIYAHVRVTAKCSHEFNIIGTQTLAQLRDKLLCSSDLGYCSELDKPINTTTSLVKETYPSGFIFIENCFYNDMRHPNAIDYSETIRSWAKQEKIGKFKVASMANTKICDIKLRLGYPYVYQHQGNCEHLLVFSKIRLLHSKDYLCSSEYPKILYEGRIVTVLCFMCSRDSSSFLVRDSDRLPFKNTYLCKDCLISYNYKDGKKIGQFKLFPYFDTCNEIDK